MKIYYFILYLSVQQILVQTFCPTNKFSLVVPKNHNSITKQAVRIIAAKWMNENPLSGSIPIDLNYEKPIIESKMFKLYYYGIKKNPSSKSFSSAVSAIASAAGDIDFNEATKRNPDYHFDAERFSSANKKVVSNMLATINFINKEQFDAARQIAGTALHILQDFYSHSNWVELGMSSINLFIGESSALFNVAPIDQPSCSDCEDEGVIPKKCYDNILPVILKNKYLTSGYFKEQFQLHDRPQIDDNGYEVHKPEGKQKCSHGGIFDSSRKVYPKGGINKDTAIDADSPHSYLHIVAADLAFKASIHFLQRIREAVNDDQKFGRFLGIYQGRCLTFVIDTTGSMGPYIDGVRQSANYLIDKWIADGNAASDYILVPFNDPDFGPVYRTKDPIKFKQWIAALYPHDGGDEPEMCYSGLKLAVDAALPGTTIHLYTDASAKDKYLKEQVLLSAKLKSIQIFYYLGGVTGKIINNYGKEIQMEKLWTKENARGIWDRWPDYTEVATQTGGALFPQTGDSQDIAKVNEVIDTMTALLKVTIFKSMITLTGNLNQNISIPVDSTLETFNIIITGKILSYQINIYEPAGTSSGSKNITVSNSVYNYMVTRPGTGQWTIMIRSTSGSSSQLSIVAVGNSEFDARTRYLSYDNSSSSAGFQEVRENPSAGAKLFIEVQSTSSNASPSKVVLVDANTFKEIARYDLMEFDSDSLINIANVIIPTQQYFVQLVGTISGSGTQFSRLVDQIITPARIVLDVAVLNGTTVLYQKQVLKINATVLNLGPRSDFKVEVSSSSGTIQASISETTFILPENATKNILITLKADPNAPVGNTTNVIIQVSSPRGDLNFYQMFFVIRSSEEVITDPEIQITSTNFNESCLAIKEQACLSYSWKSNITFKDVGSGINNFIIKELYGYNNTLIQTNNTNETYSIYRFSWITDFNAGISRPNFEFKGHIQSSCCVQSVLTRAINKMGLSVTKVIGRALKDPDYLVSNITQSTTVVPTTKPNSGIKVNIPQTFTILFQIAICIMTFKLLRE
jgi:hypothetical protein